MVKNIADFERGFETYDLATGLKSELEFQADIVIVAIGENVSELTTNDAKMKYAAAFGRLLSELDSMASRRSLYEVRSGQTLQKTTSCVRQPVMPKSIFVDLSELDRDEANMARSERKFEHAGVAAHPGDQGMRAIADAISAAIHKQSGLGAPCK